MSNFNMFGDEDESRSRAAEGALGSKNERRGRR